MRGLIWGAVLGAVVLEGGRTDSTVAMRPSSGSEGPMRHLRISEQTRYYQDGKQIGREFLAHRAVGPCHSSCTRA